MKKPEDYYQYLTEEAKGWWLGQHKLALREFCFDFIERKNFFFWGVDEDQKETVSERYYEMMLDVIKSLCENKADVLFLNEAFNCFQKIIRLGRDLDVKMACLLLEVSTDEMKERVVETGKAWAFSDLKDKCDTYLGDASALRGFLESKTEKKEASPSQKYTGVRRRSNELMHPELKDSLGTSEVMGDLNEQEEISSSEDDEDYTNKRQGRLSVGF